MSIKPHLFISIMISLFFSTMSYASNLSGMNYTPGFYFTDQDWKILQNTIDKALENSKDNVKFSWRNPKTNAWGYVVPFRTASNNKMTCRNLTIFNSAHGETGKSTFQFCKINGEWKITK